MSEKKGITTMIGKRGFLRMLGGIIGGGIFATRAMGDTKQLYWPDDFPATDPVAHRLGLRIYFDGPGDPWPWSDDPDKRAKKVVYRRTVNDEGNWYYLGARDWEARRNEVQLVTDTAKIAELNKFYCRI